MIKEIRNMMTKAGVPISAATFCGQPKGIITIVTIKLKLWPVAGSEVKGVAELSSCPLKKRQHLIQISSILILKNLTNLVPGHQIITWALLQLS